MTMLLNFLSSTFSVFPPLFQVYPDVVFVVEPHAFALLSVGAEPHALVSEPQVSVDIAVPFAVLVPVSVVGVGVDSPGRPRFFAFPNID